MAALPATYPITSHPNPPLIAVIDASVWVSRISAKDSNHMAALRWTSTHFASGDTLIAPVLLATEIAATVARVTGRPARGHLAVRQLYSVREMNLVQIDPTLAEEATNLAADLRLKGADAYYVALAKTLGIPLVTFDKEQLSRAALVITTIHP